MRKKSSPTLITTTTIGKEGKTKASMGVKVMITCIIVEAETAQL